MAARPVNPLNQAFMRMVTKKKKRSKNSAAGLGGSKMAPTATKSELALNPLSTLIARDRKRKANARGRR